EVERLLSGIEGGVLTGPFMQGPAARDAGGPGMQAATPCRPPVAAAREIAGRPLGAAGQAPAGWFAALQPPPDAMEPRISVLLPTRGRPDPLARSIGTLLDRALHPEAIEILLAVDRDDAATLAALGGMPAQVRAVVVERRGYARLHEYMNLLAREASGYWTVMWNDDNLMETRHWDEVICREPDCIGALLSAHSPGNVTPVIPRRWLAVLGRYSGHHHNDSWWDWMAKPLGLSRVLEVEFVHDRADLTGNNEDATWRERVVDGESFLSEGTQEAIRQEGRRLQAWIAFEQALAGESAAAVQGGA
ncbi:MAG: glycosyltransferase family 2 protein, partial [Chloroflexota bacterium]